MFNDFCLNSYIKLIAEYTFLVREICSFERTKYSRYCGKSNRKKVEYKYTSSFEKQDKCSNNS